MDFPSKDMRQTTHCQLPVMSLYKPQHPTVELKQHYCRVTSVHCEGEKRGGGERGRGARQREKLHHKTVRLAVNSKQIKFVVFKSNALHCVQMSVTEICFFNGIHDRW